MQPQGQDDTFIMLYDYLLQVNAYYTYLYSTNFNNQGVISSLLFWGNLKSVMQINKNPRGFFLMTSRLRSCNQRVSCLLLYVVVWLRSMINGMGL